MGIDAKLLDSLLEEKKAIYDLMFERRNERERIRKELETLSDKADEVEQRIDQHLYAEIAVIRLHDG